jgi:hypothetical protein
MKRIIQTILLITLFTGGYAQQARQGVNAILGDESFIQFFGFAPDESIDETTRLQTHLAYVEKLLREKPVAHLSAEQQQKRQQALDLLHEYWNAGIFPSNYDYAERRPCFIDKDGNICAVGYLIEKTAGRDVAENINVQHKYDYLMDMNEEVVTAWAEQHGFTLEECAMIQPSYGPVYPPGDREMPIKSSYGVSSGILGGANVAITLSNISNRGAKTRGASYIGLVTGTAQIILGAINIRKDETVYPMNNEPYIISYKNQNHLSYLNIAAGSSTIITSVLNLYINKKVKDKRNTFGLYSYPGMNREMNLGVSFARSL